MDKPNVQFNYLIEVDPECDCNLNQPVIDMCLVGTWKLDETTMREQILEHASQYPVTPNELSFKEELTFNNDGTGSNIFDWTLDGSSTHPSTRGMRVKFSWNGNGTNRFTTALGAGGKMKLCGQQLSRNFNGSMQVTLPSGMNYSMPLNRSLGSAEPSFDNNTYSCNSQELVITSIVEGKQYISKWIK